MTPSGQPYARGASNLYLIGMIGQNIAYLIAVYLVPSSLSLTAIRVEGPLYGRA